MGECVHVDVRRANSQYRQKAIDSAERYDYGGPMTPCNHQNLVLLRQEHGRVRCRHCHLTIKPSELVTRYCPECFEASGNRHYDFEEILTGESETTRYRCEVCGIMISCD